MLIRYEGADYTYDPRLLDVATAVIIKNLSDWGLKTWSAKVDDWDPLAVQLLLWAVKRQNNINVEPLADTSWYIPVFMEAWDAAWQEELRRRRQTKSVPKANGSSGGGTLVTTATSDITGPDILASSPTT
jgi:hypothetical protein